MIKKDFGFTLYKDSFLIEKDKFLDYLETYLSSKIVTSGTCKPFPLTFQRELILPISRADVNFNQTSPNYLKIITTDDEDPNETKYYYYFIERFETISNEACRCTIKMDTLQTFFFSSLDFQSKLAEKPFISRTHKDRFYPRESGKPYLIKKIDETSEGFAPQKFLNSSTAIAQKDEKLDKAQFCLIYMTPHYYEGSGQNLKEFTGGFIATLKTYNDAQIEVKTSDGTNKKLGFINKDSTSTASPDPLPRSAENVSKIIKLPYSLGSVWKNDDGSYCFASFERDFDVSSEPWIGKNSWHVLYNQKGKTNLTKSFEGIYTYTTFEEVGQNPFSETIPFFTSSDIFDSFNFESELILDNITSIKKSDSRYIEDSKLLHSDFFTYEFKFDTSSLKFDMEKLELGNEPIKEDLPEFNIKYYVSNNMNTTVLFKFEFVEGLGGYKFSSAYDNYLICNYSGELALYNDSYLSYLRNGYNYDLKAKEQSTIQNIINTFLSVGKAAVGAGISLASGGVGGAIGAGLAFSGASEIYNSIESEISNERNLERKLSESSIRNINVVGNVDAEFTSLYSPKLTLNKYNCSQRIREDLNELFYRYGYAVNRFESIDLTSRTWFNYLSGKFKFKNLPSFASGEMIEDVNNRVANGITFFHKVVLNGKDLWDIYKTKENWETSLNPVNL